SGTRAHTACSAARRRARPGSACENNRRAHGIGADTAMTIPVYELYAIKYAELARKAFGNFVDSDAHETSDMPLDYFVWAIVGDERVFVVDTGFDRAVGERRGRTLVRPVDEGLEAIGIDHREVRDVIITHLHYDHCGNADLFPNAAFHLQDAEMEYATGRSMCHHHLNHAFEADD